jgi:DNA-binding protein H-NS
MSRQLSLASIRARIRVLKNQALRIERTSTKGLRAAAAVVAKHGLSLADLRQAFAMSKRRGKRRSLARRRVPVKYRDDKGRTWTGRGRAPLWLVAAEKAGKKRESFLIGSKKARRNAAKPKKVKSKKSAAKKARVAKTTIPASPPARN